MSVGVVLEMFEARFVLRNQALEKAEHVRLHIGVGVFIDRQSASRVLREENADAVVTFRDQLFDIGRDVDHLLPSPGLDLD